MQGTDAEAETDGAIELAWEDTDSGERGTPGWEVAEEAQCRKEMEDGLVELLSSLLCGGEEEEEVEGDPQSTQTVAYHCARRDCDRLAGHTLGRLEEDCANEPEAMGVPARPGEGVSANAAQKYGRDRVHDYSADRGCCDQEQCVELGTWKGVEPNMERDEAPAQVRARAGSSNGICDTHTSSPQGLRWSARMLDGTRRMGY
jgi:hypothetical protein